MNEDADAPQPPDPPAEGSRLGEFTLLRPLGRGGQAVVWLAHQESLDRDVALKLLLPGTIGGASGAARLREEAQAASRVRHPGVAAVHGLGEAGGWHFLIQEHVAGRSLEEHLADWRALDARGADQCRTIAEWAAQIADAVEAAHAMGVIHRDLKPRNVLVDESGRPRVIDFGQALGRGPARDAAHALVGTPAYMSPEQVLREPGEIDARTDVFSLGSVLFEMLTTERAFKGTTAEQILDQVVLHDPPMPHDVVPGIPRDLSVVCAKALAKHRGERYQSMAEFAGDLRRFLAHEPIRAQPPGPLRRLSKWTRRHPARAAALAIAVIGVVGVTHFAVEAETERSRVALANDELEDAIGRIDEAYQYLDPRTDSHAARILDRTARDAVARTDGSPGGRVRLLILIGEIYEKWGLFEEAEAVARDGLAIATAALGPEDERSLRLRLVLGRALHQQYEQGVLDDDALVAAEAELEQVLATAQSALGPSHELTLDATCALGQVAWTRDDAARAEELFGRCYEGYRSAPAFGADSWGATTAGNVLGRFLLSKGRLDEAEPLIMEAYRFARQAQSRGPEDYTTNFRIGSLGRLRRAQGRLDEAEELYRESLQGLRDALGDEHHDTVASIRNLALLLGRMAKVQDEPEHYAESVSLLTEAYETSDARDEDPAETQRMLFSLANMLRQAGDFEGALPRFIELREQSLQEQGGLYRAEAHYGAGRCLQSLGRDEEAREHAVEAVREAEALSDSERSAVLPRCQGLLSDLGG